MKDAIGIPEDQLRKAAESAVCKINIDSDGRLAMTAAVREILWTKPAEFDPRKIPRPGSRMAEGTLQAQMRKRCWAVQARPDSTCLTHTSYRGERQHAVPLDS